MFVVYHTHTIYMHGEIVYRRKSTVVTPKNKTDYFVLFAHVIRANEIEKKTIFSIKLTAEGNMANTDLLTK